jgi:hypothetical protein
VRCSAGPVVCRNSIDAHSRGSAVTVEQSAEPFASFDQAVRVRRRRRTFHELVRELSFAKRSPAQSVCRRWR